MDWIGQLDWLTKLLVLLFLALVGVIWFLLLQVQDKKIEISSLERSKAITEQNLRRIASEHDALLTAVNDLVRTVDAQDREAGSPWGPSREKIEALRQRRTT